VKNLENVQSKSSHETPHPVWLRSWDISTTGKLWERR
jgi:hypothetical protein